MTASTIIGSLRENSPSSSSSSSSNSRKQKYGQSSLNNMRTTLSSVSLTEAELLEEGISMLKNNLLRPQDSDLRVLFFTATYFVLDGVTLTIRRIESHLRAKGASVKILTTVPDNITQEQAENNVIAVPGIKIPFDHAGSYAFGVGLDSDTARLIEEYNPNIVHFTVPDFVALDGIRWCQKNNVAYIATWHSNYCDYLKYYFIEWILAPSFHRYLKGFYEQIPAVYVPTPHMLAKMEKWGYGSCAELHEWGRGCDLKVFTPQRRSQQFRTSKHITETDVVILWVGRLVPEKRPDIWLNTVKRLQNEGLPVKAMVVGNGSYEKTLSQIKNVTCCGWLFGPALGEAYASADVLLFPSSVETFGNVTLEALASGCPCVVEEKCGGHLVTHGSNGFTCPAGDFEAFYQATKRIVVDAALRKTLSVNARQGSWKFERHKIMQQMLENYKDAVVRHQDPSFIKKRVQGGGEAAGRNFMSLICCNYWFVKTFAEPFLNTSHNVQSLVHGTTECVQRSRSRMSCMELTLADEEASSNSRFEDERKGRTTAFAPTSTSCIAKFLHYFACAVAYGIILSFIYASFTI